MRQRWNVVPVRPMLCESRRVSPWRRARPSSASLERVDGRLTTTSPGTKRCSPAGGAPLRTVVPGLREATGCLMPSPIASVARPTVPSGFESVWVTPEVTLGIDTPNLTPSCTVAAGRPTPGTPTPSVGLPIPMFPSRRSRGTSPPPRAGSCAFAPTGASIRNRAAATATPTRRSIPDHDWSGGREFPIRRCLCVECIARLAPKQHLRFRARETFPDPQLVRRYSKIAHHSRGEQAPSAWSTRRFAPDLPQCANRRRDRCSVRRSV